MKKLVLGILLLNVFYACSPKTGQTLSKNEGPASETPILASLDLTQVNDDKLWVEIDPGRFMTDTVTFRLPKVVQGTYDISDFGSFTEDFAAFDYSGNELMVERSDDNTWVITGAKSLDKLGYYVNDTFDIEATDKPTPFSPSGTNIEATNFVLNLHGFVGYFEELDDSEYSISITAPADMNKSSALELTSTTTSTDGANVTDTYHAGRYFEVTDNPMFYGYIDVEEFQVGDIKIVLSVYSPSGTYSAGQIKETVATMMEAQKAYLGDMNSTPRYDVFLYLSTGNEDAPQGYGALEHHTSTVVVLPEWLSPADLDESMIDVVSHEFFHIVTPLTVHSEDVHDFDYYAPTFSKHLWMYEGVTEYFASHFQVYENLQPREAFYEKMMGKIITSYTMDDSLSFTVMSENVIDEPYASNYYNVYQKGALIGMCIDILMREQSGGERSMLSLMKELSAKYGIDKSFDDDTILEEITEMTYPEIGEFLQTHVVGTTPIDYNAFFEKVGLEIADSTIETSFLFMEDNIAEAAVPFIDASQATRQVYFRDMELNSSLVEIGAQAGDTLITFNGVELTLDNIGASGLIPMSFQWGEDTEVTMTVLRDGEEIELSGLVGIPTVGVKILREKEDATEEQIQLRNYWLEKQ